MDKAFTYDEPQQQMVEEQVIVVNPIIPEQTSGIVLVESITAIVIAFIGYKTAKAMIDHRKK